MFIVFFRDATGSLFFNIINKRAMGRVTSSIFHIPYYFTHCIKYRIVVQDTVFV